MTAPQVTSRLAVRLVPVIPRSRSSFFFVPQMWLKSYFGYSSYSSLISADELTQEGRCKSRRIILIFGAFRFRGGIWKPALRKGEVLNARRAF